MKIKNYGLLLILGMCMSCNFIQSMYQPLKKSKKEDTSFQPYHRTNSNHSTDSQKKLLSPKNKKTKIDTDQANPFLKK